MATVGVQAKVFCVVHDPIVQAVPSKCSISGCGAKMAGSVRYPTAHASPGPVAATAVNDRPAMSGVGTTDQVEPFQFSATGSTGRPTPCMNPTAQASVSEVASSPNKIPEAFGSSTFGVGVSDQLEPLKEAARVRAIPEKG